MPQELLQLLQGHPPVEQELRHRVAQQVGVDPLLDARLLRGRRMSFWMARGE